MNEIVNKFLLAGDKCMPEIHLKQPRFTYSACGSFLSKTKKELKNLCRLKYRLMQAEIYERQILFTEIGLIRLAFSMIWLMVNQKI